ncbi:MAG: STAS domain-containing protein [Opitutales bacterium]|nr:STAS domain-containing protein [Opitutales bacterium]
MDEAVRYMVRVEGGEAFLGVVGRASYLNCKCVGDFFDILIAGGCGRLRVDFSACAGMDSTFMGMLAKVALAFGERGAKVELLNLKGRLLELVENLGLDAIAEISEGGDFGFSDADGGLAPSAVSKPEMLSAHESLANFNGENAEKFKDVIAFLKERSDKENL